MAHTKRIEHVLASPPRHWVGDGFHVSSVISPQAVGDRASPFVLMDYGGPDEFAPGTQPRGVDSHPHRGFETVTVVYAGELEHRDSAGNRGSIGPGDVQWMTAGRGVLHEEKHSERFTRQGGVMEMAQLWVNLPARHKMSAPRYQTLLASDIATVPLPAGAGHVRAIAGDFGDVRGSAQTFTPVIVWDGALRAGGAATLPVPEGFNAVLFVRRGTLLVHEGGVDSRPVREREAAILEPSGAGIAVSAEGEAQFLVLAGQPLGEPMAVHGPFVMNTAEEIQQAIADFRSGRFGQL